MDFLYYFNLFYHCTLIKNVYYTLFTFILNLQVKNDPIKIKIINNNECSGSNKYINSEKE